MGLITNLFMSLSPERQEMMRKQDNVSAVLDEFEIERLQEKMRIEEINNRAIGYARKCRPVFYYPAADLKAVHEAIPFEDEAYVLIHAVWTLLRKRPGHLNLCWEQVHQELESAMEALHEQLEDERIEDEADRREK